MRVLALVPGGISEQLQFFPALTTIKKTYPNAEIAMVVEPGAKSAYRVSKAVSEVIPFDYRAQNSPADWANLLGIIRDREFELALCASSRWEEGVLLWLSGIPTRIGYSTSSTSWLYTNTVTTHGQQYPSSQYQALLKGLTPSSPQSTILLNVPEGDIAWADKQRQTLGLAGSGYVVIYPGLPDPVGYPINSWLTIIDDFQEKQPQLPVVLLETADSKDSVATIARQRNLKTIEVINIGHVAAVLAGADLVLSPESYVSQMAMALKVFTLVLQTSTGTALPPATADGKDVRALCVKSATEALSDLSPQEVLKKVWGR